MTDEDMWELLKVIRHLRTNISSALVCIDEDEQKAYKTSERIPDGDVHRLYGRIISDKLLIEAWYDEIGDLEHKLRALGSDEDG